ncbi:MAG: single-stranded-DNA-specific exonuclease RecJ [Oscillospiraceae bacterium]|nr:single-stranded-DNA-specific exonuclease RecJ [Oscillospiraceae bacterium]
MKQKIWKIPFGGYSIPSELIIAGYPPLLAAVLALRNMESLSEAKTICDHEKVLHDPFGITDMDKAVDRIRAAIASGEKVAVYGDYDVDGITASCLLKKYLNSKGLECLVHIPDRESEGYGLNSDALDAFVAEGVSLVITVDCGITAADEAMHAREIGLDLIITDHHECPHGPLPEALAVIDCKRPDDNYDFEYLAGVGVAFKLACAVEGAADPILERYCDLVAVGTVSDVMPLKDENHYIVKKGLEKLNSSPCVGLKAMLNEISPDRKPVTASTIGFSIAPRLNAAGRLGEVSVAEELISCDDPEHARILACRLADLNRKRQEIGDRIWQDALARIGDVDLNAPIVLSDENWEPGVIGIAASRLADKYSLPAIMIHIKDGVGKGSCRSSGGFNLYDALSACSDDLISFGGHAPAAGLRVMKDKIDDFRRSLAAYYQSHKPEPLPDVNCELLIDDPLLLSMDNVASLELLEPFGNDNQKPVMVLYGVTLSSVIPVGAAKQHTKMTADLCGTQFDCIYFSHSPEELGIYEGCTVDIAFCPQINDYNGRNVQLSVSALKLHDGYELCSELLSRSPEPCLKCAAGFTPGRQDFIKAWRVVESRDFVVGSDVRSVMSQSPSGMPPEQFCICLIAFYQAGLLKNDNDGSLFGSKAFLPDRKADLEDTDIIKVLKSFSYNS